MVETHKPLLLAEALKIRSKGAIPMAGGTDLMVRHRGKNGLNPRVPGPVVFVDGVGELRQLTTDGDDLLIGASVPVAIIADDPGERAACVDSGAAHPEALKALPEVLRAAAADLGAPALRQRATLGGNIANASPAGDTVAALYALDAVVELASIRNTRRMNIDDFITGPGQTALAGDELITAIRIPGILRNEESDTEFRHYWRKVGTRRANALTKVSLAVVARLKGKRVASARLAYGAVSPTVVRVPEAEAILENLSVADIDEALISRVIDIVRPCIKPIDDQRSTAHYRRSVALNLTREAMEGLSSCIRADFKNPRFLK